MCKQLKVNVDFQVTVYEAAKQAAAREKKSFPDYVNCSVKDALENKDIADASEIIKSRHPGSKGAKRK